MTEKDLGATDGSRLSVEELQRKLDRYYAVIEGFWVEEINGVICTPPSAYSEASDGLPGIDFPDVNAPVGRVYCARCRRRWQEVEAIVREHDTQDAATAAATQKGSPEDGS